MTISYLRRPYVLSRSLDATRFYAALSIKAHVPGVFNQVLNLENTWKCC